MIKMLQIGMTVKVLPDAEYGGKYTGCVGVEHYESRGNLAAGKRTADQIILLKDYDPEIIRNFVERVRVYPSGEIEIDMRTSSGFAFVTAS